MTLEHLWAGWRASYIENVATKPPSDDGCLFCRLAATPTPRRRSSSRATICVFAVMNVYPYTSGHLMVAPVASRGNALRTVDRRGERAHGDDAGRDGGRRRARTTPTAPTSASTSVAPAAPASPAMCTSTSLPRWNGDTNFMTTVADARVLPEPLRLSWEKVRKHWPDPVR